jgi:hypothetical protein
MCARSAAGPQPKGGLKRLSDAARSADKNQDSEKNQSQPPMNTDEHG